jgi:hypothetical protein
VIGGSHGRARYQTGGMNGAAGDGLSSRSLSPAFNQPTRPDDTGNGAAAQGAAVSGARFDYRLSRSRIALTTSAGDSSAMKCPLVTVRCTRSGAHDSQRIRAS